MEDSSASIASIRRSVDREGKRWGLVSDEVRGRVKACRVDYRAEVRGGLGEVVRDSKMPLCTVDEESPFSSALHNRVTNGETDLARRYQMMDDLVAREQQRQADDLDADIRAEWKARKRITIGEGLYVPAHYAARAARGSGRRRR